MHEKYAALKCEFALEFRTKFEMSSLLQESMDTFDGGILVRIQVILHDLKVQAGTFGYPILLGIARIAEQYVKVMPDYDDAIARNLVALSEIMII